MKLSLRLYGQFFLFSFLLIVGLLYGNFTVAYQELLIEERGGKAIRVIKVVLDGEHFVVASVAKEGGETLEDLTKKVWGTSAVNAAFFCPKDYSNCATTHSVYERVFKGDGANYSTYWPDTSIRGIFGFEQDGTPLFVQNKISVWDVGLTSNINSERLDDLYFGISNFPVLLIRGEDVTAGAREYIDSKLTGKGSRNFICSTEDGKTVYMGVVGSSSVRDMAPYLKAQFGCYNALFLDAGASLGMVYDGKVLDRGSRRMITDAFVVVDKEAYLKLGGKIPENVTPYQPEYELTEKDMNKIELQSQILDRILKRYAGKVKTPSLLFITPFRKAMTSGKLSVSQKAFYNQLLIHLYTIDML